MGPGVGQIWADWQKMDEIHGEILEKNMEKKSERSPDFLRELWAFCWSCSVGSDVNASWCFIFVQVDLFLNSLKVLKLKQQTDLRRSHKDPTKTRSTSAAEGRPAAFATCMPLTPAATPGASACLGCEPAAFAGCKRDVHHQPVRICGSLWIVVGVWCVRYITLPHRIRDFYDCYLLFHHQRPYWSVCG